MARLRQQVALVAVILGSVVAVAGTALIANAIGLGTRLLASSQPHDTYYVVSTAWLSLLIFGVGAAGDMAFRSEAKRLGGRAALIWQTHLLFTTVLIIAWLVAGRQAQMTWPAVSVLFFTNPLMFIAHGAALAAGGMTV